MNNFPKLASPPRIEPREREQGEYLMSILFQTKQGYSPISKLYTKTTYLKQLGLRDQMVKNPEIKFKVKFL